jgi:Aspartyl/Asparaginyl beta-hydroxylase
MLKFDPDYLERELGSLPVSAWSLPSNYADTGVHHKYQTMGIRSYGVWSAEETFAAVVDYFEPIRSVSITKLNPGGFIIPHTDGTPHYERWQIPIRVAGSFENYEMEIGVPFLVHHWKVHSVWNPTKKPRIHLLIDRDIPLLHYSVTFMKYPELIPDRYKEMVRLADGHLAS